MELAIERLLSIDPSTDMGGASEPPVASSVPPVVSEPVSAPPRRSSGGTRDVASGWRHPLPPDFLQVPSYAPGCAVRVEGGYYPVRKRV